MITDPALKDFTLIRKTIDVKKIGEKFYLTPFGDIHEFAPNHHEARWKEWKEDHKKAHTPNHYYLGMGDYLDFLAAKERMWLENPSVHESTRGTMDTFVQDINMKFINGISFMKDNIIGNIEGNHFFKYQSGGTTTMQMCEHLNAPYLGTCAVIKLHFNYKGRYASIVIFAHHGTTSGRLPGSTFNKVEQMREIFPNCDIYLQAHDHHRGALPITAMLIRDSGKKLRLHYKKQWLGRTGSFLNAYVPNSQSYIAKRLKSPMDLGTITFELEFKSVSKGARYFYIDIHAWT